MRIMAMLNVMPWGMPAKTQPTKDQAPPASHKTMPAAKLTVIMTAAGLLPPTALIKAAVRMLAGALTRRKTAEPSPAVEAENPSVDKIVGSHATVV